MTSERAQHLVKVTKCTAIVCAIIAVLHYIASWVLPEMGTYYRVGFYGWLILASVEANAAFIIKALRNDVE